MPTSPEIYYVCLFTDDADTMPAPIERYSSYNLAQARCDLINNSGQTADHKVYVVPHSLMWTDKQLQEDDRG